MTEQREKSVSFWPVVMAVAAVILSFPFFSATGYETIDTIFHLNRIEGIKEGLLYDCLPVRINGYSLNGYGTPLGIMYPDLLLYFPALLRVWGVSLAVAYNSFWIFAVWLGLAAAWRGFTLWSGSLASGAVAAMLYNSSFVMMIHLGMSPGDYPAMCVLPLILGALYAVLARPGGDKHWPEYVAAFTLSAQSHVLTTLLAGLLSVGFLLYYGRLWTVVRGRRSAVAKIAVFCLLLNVWRLAPMLYFYVNVNFQIFAAPWSRSLHELTSNWPNLVRSQFFIGYPLALWGLFCLANKAARHQRGWLATALVMAVLVSMLWQAFPWAKLEGLLPGEGFLATKFQYPHRFMFLGLPFFCHYLGKFATELPKKYFLAYPAAVGLICCVWGIGSAMFGVWYFYGNAPQTAGLGIRRTWDSVPSYGIQEDYLYSDVIFRNLRNGKGEVPGPDDFISSAEIFDAHKRGTAVTFSYNAAVSDTVRLPLFYWPGYAARSVQTGNELPLSAGDNHIMQVTVPPGTDTVYVHYVGLWWFRIFDIISLLSLIIFIIFWFKERRND